ncbi:MAG: zinc ribbon domain-containing protein [Gemmatimonadota bacterium]|nr:zinc ribbon domain-containing protein [Gemmatimonadota bacterium]
MIPPDKNTTAPGATGALPPGGFCSACGAALSLGARFCHRCGTPVGQGAPIVAAKSNNTSPVATALPWAVAFVALLALVSNFVGKNFGRAKGSAVDGSSNAIANPSIDNGGAAPFAGGQPANGPPVSGAPDINNMSNSERANRLYVRIMTYAENNKMDSVGFFAPMAIAAHGMIEKPSNDERYHFGRIAEITGDAAIARAQADTILQTQPNSLLGLLLEVRVARMNSDKSAEAKYNRELLKNLTPELAKNLPDYQVHRAEIDRASAEAREKK